VALTPRNGAKAFYKAQPMNVYVDAYSTTRRRSTWW